MYTVTCTCGTDITVSAATAGGDVTCPRCRTSISVPSLRHLKTQAGESLSSPTAGLAQAIADRAPPFDGACQVCNKVRATEKLRVSLRYLVERLLTGESIPFPKIGYAPAEEYWNVLDVPCFFCAGCAGDFRRSWRRASARSFLSMLLRVAWLAPLAMIAIVLLSMLPLVGITGAAFVIYAAYRNMTRKRADSFVIRHLRTIDGVSRLLDAHDEYIVTCGGFSGVDDGGVVAAADGQARP